MTDSAALLDPAARSALGLATQAEAIGAPAPDPVTPLQASWRDFVFAEVWSRPGLDRRARFLIALAGAASGGGSLHAIESYARGALASGELTLAELREAALHYAVYGGWTRGSLIDAGVTNAARSLGLPEPETAPIRAAPWDADERRAEGARNFETTMLFGGPPPVVPYFDAGILNFVFGEMWCRPGLDQRARRWLTVVGVCESAADTPIRSHIHAAIKSGNCTVPELHEFVLQYAVHAGWPRASMIQGVVFAMAKKVAEGLPYDG